MPLFPLIEKNLIDINDRIVIDSKSGISGAGRKESAQYLFAERNDNTLGYAIFNHRHRYEIAEKLAVSWDKILFTPHLIPTIRGIESTIYVKINKNVSFEDIKKCLNTYYQNSYFVKIVDFIPSTSIVKGTNNIAIYIACENDNLIISCVIDNICKGSSGCAIQSMNINFDFKEDAGLNFLQSYI